MYPKFYLYNRIVKAKLYIDDNYCNNIDLSNISDEACFSRFHFLRLFKSVYGKTPHQYLIQVRINKAMEFLEQDFKINDTCFKVGFDSVSSFSGLFRRMHGCSPSEYQRLYKIRQANIKARPLNYIPNCFVEPIK
ncbi:MAG: helix-turn-helix transcriptional regulator [Chitinophagaceae bacterium]|nr:helix-turn-helix transcriptional regulator [Chitinophagaceae bacterium]